MKKTLLPVAALGLILSATGAMAALEDFLGADSDKSGLVSWSELSVLYPDVSEREFQAADLDRDGELTQDEFDTLILSTGAVGAAPPLADEPQPLPNTLTYDKPAS